MDLVVETAKETVEKDSDTGALACVWIVAVFDVVSDVPSVPSDECGGGNFWTIGICGGFDLESRMREKEREEGLEATDVHGD